MTATTVFPCQRCGMLLFHGNLACPNCGALVYSQALNEIAARAQHEEAAGNALSAVMIWRQALALLPPDSRQHQTVMQRIGALSSRWNAEAGMPAAGAAGMPAAGTGSSTDGPAEAIAPAAPAKPAPKNDPLPLALAKTLGSMLVSIIIYTLLFSGRQGLSFGLQFATGFVLLMLVHELGHSIAMRYYRLSASPPIFIPFLGAFINLRQLPRNALEEAVVGIGGPVTGTIAALVTYLIYLQTGSQLFLLLAWFGFLLNLFNMLPVPPLDGGRVTAAVSPWVWLTGLLAVVIWIAREILQHGRINPILILLLLMAWPRVLSVFSGAHRRHPYYQIGRRARWGMGIAYILLGGTLYAMFELCRTEAQRLIGPGWMG